MKDFSSYSDDELLDELDHLSLELSCLMGTEEGDTIEKMYWMVMDEVNKRKEEDKIEDDYVSSEGDEVDDEGLRDNLGRSFDEWGDLPF